MLKRGDSSLLREQKKRRLMYNMPREFCPNCRNEEVDWEDGKLVCADCGFRGNAFSQGSLIDVEEDDFKDEIDVVMQAKIKKEDSKIKAREHKKKETKITKKDAKGRKRR